MAKVAATILATTPAEYAERIDRVKPFARRVHVDIADGVFAPNKTIGPSQVYGVDGAELDLHIMVEYPESQIQNLLCLEPDLVIFHFESHGDLGTLFKQLKEVGIRAGLAIKPDTTIEQIKSLLPQVDHLLVFTGALGFNGGQFDGACLGKIQAAKAINPNLEVGVDGGVNQETAHLCIQHGADVLNSGSFIHDAPDPEAAYLGLEAIATGESSQ
ncbi:MAG TPA: hypothetical protein VK963_02230 [Candidatus Saccharimonadales bacterium]|nr:hypothetical protein [Candidatus Saccharimonadales bacterium]